MSATASSISRRFYLPALLAIANLAVVQPFMAAPASPLRADLSLGRVATQTEAALPTGLTASASALAHYSSALQLESVGKLREALEQYLAVLQLDPANPSLAMRTAELAYNFQGRDQAIAILEKAIRSAPKVPTVYLNLAQFCATYTADDPFEKDRAETVMQEALQLFPTSAEVYSAGVMLNLSRRQRSEAIALMNRAASQTSVSDPNYWLTMGRAAQQVWPLGQTETREAHLEHVNPYFLKAAQVAKGKEAEKVQLEVAQYYLLTNQLPQAREWCEKLAANYKNLQARKLLYRLYDAQDEKEKALGVLKSIVAETPNDVEQRKLLGSAYEAEKNYPEAVKQFEAALQVGGGQTEDYLALGELMLRGHLYEKAVQLTERSQRLFPDQAMFQVQAALAHGALEHWPEAVKAFAEATALAEASQPEILSYRYYFEYARALERAGRIDEAAKTFEKSILITPKDNIESAATTMNYLGYMWLELNQNLEKAGELIQNANELQPNNAAYIDSLGWWHFKKGDFPAALKELLRAETLLKELQPEDAEILEHISRVYAAMKQPQKAKEYLLRAQALQPTDAKVRKQIEEGLKKL